MEKEIKINEEKWPIFSELLEENINELRRYREMLWESSVKGTTGFYVQYFEGIFSIKESVEKIKDHLSDENYKLYLKEYNMTILLLESCLLKAKTGNSFLSTQDKQLIEQTMSKISIDRRQIANKEEISLYLSEEDPTTRLKSQHLGLAQNIIEDAINNGIIISGTLENEPNISQKK